MDEEKALKILYDIKHSYVNQKTGAVWTDTEELLAEYCMMQRDLIEYYESKVKIGKVSKSCPVDTVELWVDVFDCPNCDGGILRGDNYCSSCGTEIEWVD